ncbi:MAG: ATP-binding cassette domain-containing protein [Gemmatimonas sp.]|nr:ATP-binding cassette domain-containing protein [Gemmatimonas sp.]
MITRLRARPEWRFFEELPRADAGLATAWFGLLLGRGMLPAAFAIAMGTLVSAVEGGDALGPALTLVAVLFVGMQVLSPLHAHVGTNLGDVLSSHLNGLLLDTTTSPDGIAHLERPELSDDLTMARDFDLGISGPPMAVSMGFIAGGLAELIAGAAQAIVLFGYRWWPPLVLALAWGSTHWLLRESAIWRDRQTQEVMEAQRHADYTYRLAVDSPAAKELRLFGLADWTVDRFADRRRRLVDLRWEATRLRQRSVRWALLFVVLANVVVFWSLARDAASGAIGLGLTVTFAVAALGTHSLAFGGLNWALTLGAAPTVDAVLRLDAPMRAAGRLQQRGARPAGGMPARDIVFREVSFAYDSSAEPVLAGVDLTIPAGTSLAVVGQNGAGKTTLAKLLCRLYDVGGGAIEVDGIDLRDLDLESWRRRVTAVFQDFVRYELTLRDNVSSSHTISDEEVRLALEQAGAEGLASLDTILAKGYPGGTDLSGGQWQRVALARVIASVRAGAGVVILDEPTAQLDVRGEAEIFQRILAATRQCTTILVSHRFSTVRRADRICVLEGGRVIELGTHSELIELGGRYRTMFDLQAQRFGDRMEDPDVISLV